MNNITKNILTGFKSVILNEATQKFPGGISEESFEKAIETAISDFLKTPEYRSGIEVYTDYTDIKALEDNTEILQDVLHASDPMDKWVEVIYETYVEAEDNANLWFAQEKLLPAVCDICGVEMPAWFNLSDSAQDKLITAVQESGLAAYVDGNKLLSKAESNITISNNKEYSRDEIAEFDENGNIVALKDVGKAILKILGVNEEEFLKGDNQFVKDIAEEIINIDSYSSGVTLTFCVKSSWDNAIELVQGDNIVISKGTYCGFVDFNSGAGSTFDIRLPKDITISRKDFDINVDNEMEYGVDKIYGMSGSFWNAGEAVVP